MSNLFSIFDPVVLFFPINWISSVIILFFLPSLFWMANTQIITFFSLLMTFLYSEFEAIFGKFMAPGGALLSVSFFLFIVLNNFMGLFPYIFTSSSHLTFTITLALPLWLGHMIFAWASTPVNMLAHLVPIGTPSFLAPFMVLIEMISSLIRPLTLSVRLAANMVAGHLLLTLLSNQANTDSLLILPLVVSALVLLGILESAVAIIQAYVFSVLSTLYVNEVNSFSMNL